MSYHRDDPLTSFLIPTSSSPIPLTESDSYLIDPTTSASGSFQNEGLLASDSGNNSESEFGFFRPEWKQSPLVGTVEIYDRHVFLCYKNPKVWPAHVEAAEFDRLPRLLSAALLARKNEMKKQTRLTICEGHDGTETSNGDVLIFPDMIRYRRLTHFDVDTFVEEVLVKDTEWHPGTPEMLTGSYVFVCSHGSRDRRCGVCGPALVTRFREEIDTRGIQGQVSVSPCSHIGGHKYAGNVIIFCPNIDGRVTGHWYGYVTPDDVPILLEQHIGQGEIIDPLWRGQMGLSEEDQKKAQELRLRQSMEVGTEKITREPFQVYETSQSQNQSEVEVAGCCQGNGSTSCCQNPVLPEKVERNHTRNEKEAQTGVDKKKSTGKRITRTNSIKGGSTRKLCSMPTWIESWEAEDTYASLAVLAAIVSVAVAYSSYKQLGST